MVVQLLGGAPASLNTGSKQQALEDPAPLSTHRSLAQGFGFREQMTRFPTKGFVCIGFYSQAKVQKGDPAFGAGIVTKLCPHDFFLSCEHNFHPSSLTHLFAARGGIPFPYLHLGNLLT